MFVGVHYNSATKHAQNDDRETSQRTVIKMEIVTLQGNNADIKKLKTNNRQYHKYSRIIKMCITNNVIEIDTTTNLTRAI